MSLHKHIFPFDSNVVNINNTPKDFKDQVISESYLRGKGRENFCGASGLQYPKC